MLLLNQVLGFISPLIVKEILDEHITGIEQTWYQVDSKDDTTVLFNGNYYKQFKNFDDDESNYNFDEAIKGSVFLYQNKFYFVEAEIERGTKHLENNTLTITENQVYIYNDVVLLTAENVTSFISLRYRHSTLIAMLFVKRCYLLFWLYSITTENKC